MESKLESLQSERSRLREQQSKARNDQVFGALTNEDIAAYDDRSQRLDELEVELKALATTAEAKMELARQSKPDRRIAVRRKTRETR
jgi:hypothetical protein